MTSDTANSSGQQPEQEIEKLAQEIGRLIQRADPERREELKELAYTLIREEVFQRGEGGRAEDTSPPGPFNPLGSGVLILVLGAGLSFIFGPVGLLLILVGLIFILWGAAISWLKR